VQYRGKELVEYLGERTDGHGAMTSKRALEILSILIERFIAVAQPAGQAMLQTTMATPGNAMPQTTMAPTPMPAPVQTNLAHHHTGEQLAANVAATEALKDSKGKEVIFYVIDVQKGGASWQTKKRFAEFDILLKEVQWAKIDISGIGETFPKKTFSWPGLVKLKPAEISDRRKKLSQFLAKLVEKVNAEGASPLQKSIHSFLQVTKHTQGEARSGSPSNARSSASPHASSQRAQANNDEPVESPQQMHAVEDEDEDEDEGELYVCEFEEEGCCFEHASFTVVEEHEHSCPHKHPSYTASPQKVEGVTAQTSMVI
jgi:hypothetical protein